MTAIVSLVATIIGFAIWLIKRRAANDELPQTQLKKYEDQARSVIAASDSAGVNVLLDDRLHSISRNSSGQGSGSIEGGADKPEGRLPSA
jgi:hypothetical protein